MTKILVTPRSLKTPDHAALAPLREAGYEVVIPSPGTMPTPEALKAALPGCRGWLAGVEHITADIMDAAPDLRIISRNGVGVDTVDLEAAAARGIKVVNTPGANARGVAELALGLIFSLARGIPACDASIKAGGWERRQGIELAGKTLGVAGCGQIGKTLSRLGIAVGMRVVACDLYPDPDFSLPDFSYVKPEDLVREADVISLHVPGGDRPFLDRRMLGLCAEGALIVNTARAGAVDVDCLLECLDSGRVAGYGVDAFAAEPPGATRLTTHPRVVCTSHIGGFTAESVMRAATQAARNIVEALW